MKLFKPQFLFFLLVIPMMISCDDEPAPLSTTKEIISEISRQWSCNTAGDDGVKSFDATISIDPSNESKILITNFHQSGYTDKLSATVKIDNTIIIPRQSIGNQFFEGDGEISNDYSEITWVYTIEFEGGILNITATFTYGVTS